MKAEDNLQGSAPSSAWVLGTELKFITFGDKHLYLLSYCVGCMSQCFIVRQFQKPLNLF